MKPNPGQSWSNGKSLSRVILSHKHQDSLLLSVCKGVHGPEGPYFAVITVIDGEYWRIGISLCAVITDHREILCKDSGS